MKYVLFLCILEKCKTIPTLAKQRNSVLNVKLYVRSMGKSLTEGNPVNLLGEGVRRGLGSGHTVHRSRTGAGGWAAFAAVFVEIRDE